MSKQAEIELRENICAKEGCWRVRQFSEAGVTANLRGPWKILLLDSHFQRCASPRRGGICDAIAVYPSQANTRLRLLELKQSLDDLPKDRQSPGRPAPSWTFQDREYGPLSRDRCGRRAPDCRAG